MEAEEVHLHLAAKIRELQTSAAAAAARSSRVLPSRAWVDLREVAMA
jgi:hypothetical protein